MSTPATPIATTAPASPREAPLVTVRRHATRHFERHLTPNIVTALRTMGLQPGREADLYITDEHVYELPDVPGRTITLYQIHPRHDLATEDLKDFSGLTVKIDSMNADVVTVCSVAFPLDEPLVVKPADLPIAEEGVKYSLSRQGFIARVSAPLGRINVTATTRNIHCENSRFNGGEAMLDVFLRLAKQHDLDLDALFPTAASRTYCHVFFVAYEDMRLIPLDYETDHLSYLGSFKQQSLSWAMDDDDGVVLEKMVPCDAPAALERLRPAYYTPAEAPALLEAGWPLLRWEEGKRLRRVLPPSYQEKERLRGDTPNLEHAWYKLMETGEEDRLAEVLTPAQQHLPAEYRDRHQYMLDSDPATYIGPNPPTAGTLVDYLYTNYLAVTKQDADRAHHLDRLPKATKAFVLTMLQQRDYWRRCVRQNHRKARQVMQDHTAQMLLFTRRQLWEQEPRSRIYTLLTEAKRAAKRDARRAAHAEAAAIEPAVAAE